MAGRIATRQHKCSNLPLQPEKPETAKRQLDHVFASTELTNSLTMQALNGPDEWGPSDQCRIEIEFAPGA